MRLLPRLFCLLALPLSLNAQADLPATIEKVKPSIVIVGTFSPTGSPQFALRGTGFVVGDGNQVATNAHVLPGHEPATATPPPTGAAPTPSNGQIPAALVVQVRLPTGEWQMRPATILAVDKPHDLALLRFEGPAVPRLSLRDNTPAREGQNIALMGFPIGGALGFSPVTHRGIISSYTPIVLPSGNARGLNASAIRRAKEGSFNIYQLDATAYPGNSGGPMFDADTGEVLGIINMVFVKGSKESALSQPSGITYAIPVSYLNEMLGRR